MFENVHYFFFLIGAGSGTEITCFPFKLWKWTLLLCTRTVRMYCVRKLRGLSISELAWLDSLVRTLYERLALQCSCVTSHLAIWLDVTLESEPMAWLYNLHSRLASVSGDVCHGRWDVAQTQRCAQIWESWEMKPTFTTVYILCFCLLTDSSSCLFQI